MTTSREATRLDRALARILIFAIATMNSLPAMAGDEFDDANNTRFDESNVALDNTQAGQTIFTIDTDSTTIEWQDLQQPEDNHLQFNFTETDGGARVLNVSRSISAIALNGRTSSNGIVGFAGDAGLFINGNAVIDVAGLVAIGSQISAEDFANGERFDLQLSGDITNQGVVTADGNIVLLGRHITNEGLLESGEGSVLLLGAESASIKNWDSLTEDFLGQKNLFGLLGEGTITNSGQIESQNAALLAGRVVNQGEIEVQDGTLLVVGADAVYVSQFDNPVLIRLPHRNSEQDQDAAEEGQEPEYAIENHGTMKAGLGHVRLAAADPLGFGIRQGSGTGERRAEIAAKTIDIEAGENGRVQISGRINADAEGKRGLGGDVNITGEIIALVDAEISASGKGGGGQIQIGGEQQGLGELQRARSVIVDKDSTIRANAKTNGDGGRIVVFAEDLTSIDGRLAARGGNKGGDGGFIETSGLLRFAISTTPNLEADAGKAGHWLIDPYNIRIGADPAPCAGLADTSACGSFNAAIDAIIAPNFDSTGFDGILRTVVPNPDVIGDENFVSADLIERALGIGVDVTISTQVFGDDMNDDPTAGDIILDDAISIMSADVREGTIATLTLRAAGDILINNAIEVLSGGDRSNLALGVSLFANDAAQDVSDRDFGTDLVSGDVLIDANIRTGGGDVDLSGISVVLNSGRTIDTDGGAVRMLSGTLDANRTPTNLERQSDDPEVTDPIDGVGPADPLNPRIEIAGQINTARDYTDANSNTDGGNIVLSASSLNVGVRQRGDDPLQVVTGLVSIDAASTLQSGGGDIAIAGGSAFDGATSNFSGNVDIDGDLISDGGAITITANSQDPRNDTGSFAVTYLTDTRSPGDEGGVIDLDGNISTDGGVLVIGNDTALSISLDGDFDTTSSDVEENGLVRITALDTSAVNIDDDLFGNASVTLGAEAGTTIQTAGLIINTRDLVTGESGGGNAVDITVSGDSSENDDALATTTTLADGSLQTTPNIATVGEAQLTGSRQVTFNPDTEITAEAVRIIAAADPLQLNNDETSGFERGNSETRLRFVGTSGGDANGVLLNTDLVEISVGNGITETTDLTSTDLGTDAAPTDFGLERLAEGDYSGLQLRSFESDSERPEEISIQQDADLTVSAGGPSGPSEIDFAGAFGATSIGSEGMRTTLESSDGILSVRDAAGLNNTSAFVDEDNDAGQSYVVLNGGLALAATEGAALPETVVLGNGVGQALGLGGTTALDVRSLALSTPGDFTVSAVAADSIDAATELTIETGRRTELDDAVESGSLTVDANVSLLASLGLALRAAASGFGDLVFAGTGITLSSDEIELRAGAGEATQNSDSGTRSEIENLASNNVSLRDGSGGIFGDGASSATSFSYRQDDAINAEISLPEIEQFGLVETVGFRSEGDVEYKVRSDFGQIDLDSGDDAADADRFENASISLIGTETGGADAIAIGDNFVFEGKRVELGGTGNFTFDQSLATAFNRDGSDADQEITLRAGTGETGNLDFNRGGESSVLVKAPRINLVAGDGVSPGSGTNSDINVNNASFDLAGPGGALQTFVYQIDDTAFRVSDLPDADQFVGTGNAALPDVLAIRNDVGALTIEDFDVAELPLDLTDDPGRLVLESDFITLSSTDGSNLELTTNPNLNLRLRANSLVLEATENNNDLFGDANNARVRIDARAGDGTDLTGDDASFSARSLLIEAFDEEAEVATAANLSSLSEDPLDENAFDLAEGRAPTTISIRQDGAVSSGELFLQTSVSGLLGRVLEDDEDEEAIASNYTIESILDSVTVAAENVNGSALTLRADVETDIDTAITLSASDFVLDSLNASTEDSILIEDGTSILADKTLTLSATTDGSFPEEETTEPFGRIVFDDASGGTTTLAANQIQITAGPAFALTDPDADNDDERDVIADALLPKIDFSGLAGIAVAGDGADPSLRIQQSGSLNTLTSEGDFVSALLAGGGFWDETEIVSLQGELRLTGIDTLSDVTRTLIAASGIDGSVFIDMPANGVTDSPFEEYDDEVRVESNHITFATDAAGTSLNLASERLRLVTGTLLDGTETDEERFRVDSDPDSLERPTLTIRQVDNFTNTELPLPSQYFTTNIANEVVQRETLEDIEIVLESTGTNVLLTLDNDIRSRTTTSNLRLISEGDIAIDLTNQTEGFEDIPGYAALQLASLELNANGGADSGVPNGVQGDGTITISNFTEAGVPANLSIDTQGDQRFNGLVELQETLETTGRDLAFTGDIFQNGTPDAGIVVASTGNVRIGGNVGTDPNPLDRFWAIFDSEERDATPTLTFDGAGDQSVFTENDILVAAGDLTEGTLIDEIETEIGSVSTLAELETLSSDLELGRTRLSPFATIGKASGNLTLDTENGFVGVTSGERLAVGGDLLIDSGASFAQVGDVAAINLDIVAAAIGIVRRGSGTTSDRTGASQQDGGVAILANTIDFGGLTPLLVGRGSQPIFGVPDPFDLDNQPAFLQDFAVFEINPTGSDLDVDDFAFRTSADAFDGQVRTIQPGGASRSDLSGANGPVILPTPKAQLDEPARLRDPERLLALAVETREAASEVQLARLSGAAIINDLDLPTEEESTIVTASRLDASDAEAAFALYEELFGPEGEQAADVRAVLQDALDQYLETTRSRRVVGFELRRFVKNRPSTLLDAYATLEGLDSLFRYHRRLGLSPGEFRRVQSGWLRQIQPDGISLDELSEAIHPSRYVRGSDILDIFGR
ncbi:MAG: hypothetical protein AB8G23_11715 [Myxococcota bacterium]